MISLKNPVVLELGPNLSLILNDEYLQDDTYFAATLLMLIILKNGFIRNNIIRHTPKKIR